MFRHRDLDPLQNAKAYSPARATPTTFHLNQANRFSIILQTTKTTTSGTTTQIGGLSDAQRVDGRLRSREYLGSTFLLSSTSCARSLSDSAFEIGNQEQRRMPPSGREEVDEKKWTQDQTCCS